jgi:pilus assembly protein CpaB
MRTKLVLALAIIMGSVTTVLFYKYISNFQQEAAVNETIVEVVTAREAIAKNERITASKLAVSRVPELGVHANALRDAALAEGMIAETAMEPGEVVLSHHLKDVKEETLFVSRKIQEGYRAVSVGVNIVQSVANLIEPEDYVDVIVSKSTEGSKELESQILFTKVRVLAVGRRMIESETGTPYVEYSEATLELKPEQTVKLVNASVNGTIHLTLHTRVNERQADSVE